MTPFDRRPHSARRHPLGSGSQVTGRTAGGLAHGAYRDYILSFRGPLCKYLYSKQLAASNHWRHFNVWGVGFFARRAHCKDPA